MSTVFIGLMSGTSLDGIDGVVAEFDRAGHASPAVLGHVHQPFPPTDRSALLALNESGADEIHRAALAANALARGYAQVVGALLERVGLTRDQVAAIGCHGQTVRHRPGAIDGIGYTVQLNAPALLAELCGIDVVADFRSRDLAAGGQGAPLVPAFHRAFFSVEGQAIGVLNLGGIANLTSVRADGSCLGFDCGPANALLDHWCSSSTGRPYDQDGAWAASGQVDQRLLESCLCEPFFAQQPPKSTGRDLFNQVWLERHLTASGASLRLAAVDVQATLAELIARVCATACQTYAPEAPRVVVCGGGAFNADLRGRLERLLGREKIVRSGELGLPEDQVESVAFAWLARAFTRREPGNVPGATGAVGPRVLGALYPAG